MRLPGATGYATIETFGFEVSRRPAFVTSDEDVYVLTIAGGKEPPEPVGLVTNF